MAQLGFTLRSDSRSVYRENRLKTRVPKSQRLKKVAKDKTWTGQRRKEGQRADRKGTHSPRWPGLVGG